jgi:hypothetical protein
MNAKDFYFHNRSIHSTLFARTKVVMLFKGIHYERKCSRFQYGHVSGLSASLERGRGLSRVGSNWYRFELFALVIATGSCMVAQAQGPCLFSYTALPCHISADFQAMDEGSPRTLGDAQEESIPVCWNGIGIVRRFERFHILGFLCYTIVGLYWSYGPI